MINGQRHRGTWNPSISMTANWFCYWPLSSGGGNTTLIILSDIRRWWKRTKSIPIFTSTMFAKVYLFNLQLCSDAVSIKFSHFSQSNSLSLSNRGKVNSTGMSWFLCGQTEMSELALEQNGWRSSNRSGKANELSDCCHTRWQTAADVWRLPASPTQPPAPMGPLCYPHLKFVRASLPEDVDTV